MPASITSDVAAPTCSFFESPPFLFRCQSERPPSGSPDGYQRLGVIESFPSSGFWQPRLRGRFCVAISAPILPRESLFSLMPLSSSSGVPYCGRDRREQTPPRPCETSSLFVPLRLFASLRQQSGLPVKPDRERPPSSRRFHGP